MAHSRPHSRAPSIVEAPIGSSSARPGLSRQNSQTGSHAHGHNHQDPKLFGPGFTSAPTHSAVDAQVKYVLVTPAMLQAIETGHAPHTNLVQPHDGPGLHNGAPVNTLSYQKSEATTDVSEKRDIAHLANSDEPVITGIELEDEPYLPNPIARFRHWAKEPLGEFLGTMVLIIFGNGVNCQVVLSELTQGSYLSISFGWGIGVMMGIYACGGISGAHLNPAVTISLAVWRGFPWKKVPGYFLGQLLGACLGSALIQGNYHALLNQYEGGYNVRTYGEATSTGALFFTAAKPYMSNIGAFFSEFLATTVLLTIILALGDSNNNPVPAGMNGHTLLWLIVGIGAALGTETAYCLNPARDWGPRIAASMYGYPNTIWTDRNGYWFYTAGLAPVCGAIFAGFVYDLLIFTGKESPMNKPWGKKSKQIDA